jgi:hypothetical protein
VACGLPTHGHEEFCGTSPHTQNASGIGQGQPKSGSARSLFLMLFPSVMLPMFMGVADQTIVAIALPAIAAKLGEIQRVPWIVLVG